MRRKVLLFFAGCSFCRESEKLNREVVPAGNKEMIEIQEDIFYRKNDSFNTLSNINYSQNNIFMHGNLIIEKTTDGISISIKNEVINYTVPLNHFLTLELKKYKTEETLVLYFISGNDVHMKTQYGFSNFIELLEVTPGPYTLKIIRSENNITDFYKIIKY